MATFLLSSEDKFVDQCEPQSLDRIDTDNMRPEYLEPTLNLILALVIIFLHGIALIILVNILLRPSLWTAFNIVGLIYLCLTIVLGSYKLVQISVLVSTFLKLEETDGIVIDNRCPLGLGFDFYSIFIYLFISILELDRLNILLISCSDLASVLVIESDLRISCAGLVYWSGTFTAREGILTSLVFTRSGVSIVCNFYSNLLYTQVSFCQICQ